MAEHVFREAMLLAPEPDLVTRVVGDGVRIFDKLIANMPADEDYATVEKQHGRITLKILQLLKLTDTASFMALEEPAKIVETANRMVLNIQRANNAFIKLMQREFWNPSHSKQQHIEFARKVGGKEIPEITRVIGVTPDKINEWENPGAIINLQRKIYAVILTEKTHAEHDAAKANLNRALNHLLTMYTPMWKKLAECVPEHTAMIAEQKRAKEEEEEEIAPRKLTVRERLEHHAKLRRVWLQKASEDAQNPQANTSSVALDSIKNHPAAPPVHPADNKAHSAVPFGPSVSSAKTLPAIPNPTPTSTTETSSAVPNLAPAIITEATGTSTAVTLSLRPQLSDLPQEMTANHQRRREHKAKQRLAEAGEAISAETADNET